MQGNKLQKILVIDDNRITGYITEQILADLDLAEQILLVTDGQEAISAIKSGLKADLILLDLNMPRMGGFAFLDEYQSLGATATEKPRVIIFTTSTRPEDRQRASTYDSVLGYWEKPISKQKILVMLDKIKEQL